MNWMKRAAQGAAPLVSAKHRRWKRLLASLTFDPADASGPLEEPGAADFIICGCPRTGTSLLSAQLYQPPKVVTVMEPWDGLRMAPAALFADLRQELAGGVLRRGKLDIDRLEASGEVQWWTEGHKVVPAALEEEYQLGVKWTAFWRYLDFLPTTRFLVCVRDPAETVASFKKSGGRLERGLNYDVPFNGEMNSYLETTTHDPELRRVLLYEYINKRVIPHLDRPEVFVVRYERWFSEPDALRDEIAEFVGVSLAEWRVSIRPPAAASDQLSERERKAIRERCPSAEALGYQAPGA